MLKPERICFVAAHNHDLATARGCGFRTGFIPGPGSTDRGRQLTLSLLRIGTWLRMTLSA
jgi:2-haloacid dehalogenase